MIPDFLTKRPVYCPGLRVLVLGRTLARARYWLNELVRENKEQVIFWRGNEVLLADGTLLIGASASAKAVKRDGVRFDQVFAEPGALSSLSEYDLCYLHETLALSDVPEEFQIQFLDCDAD